MELHADPTCIFFSAEAGHKIKKVLEIIPTNTHRQIRGCYNRRKFKKTAR